MQYLTTGVESLSRRIALSGVLSRWEAERAIKSGNSVLVNGHYVDKGCRVPDATNVFVKSNEGFIEIPPPPSEPPLWGLIKPRGVVCSIGGTDKSKNSANLTDLINSWNERISEDTTSLPTHTVVVNRMPTMATGIVLLTTDGVFARTLTKKESKILTTFRVRTSPISDTTLGEMRYWRNLTNPVFVDVENRNDTQCWLKVRLVVAESYNPNLLSNLFWFRGSKTRVNRVNLFAFGPYKVTDIPERMVSKLPIHESLVHFVERRDIKPVLVRHAK